jgi:hypothetical protein
VESVRIPDFDKRKIKEDKKWRPEDNTGCFLKKTRNRMTGKGKKVAMQLLIATELRFSVLEI